MATPLSHGIIAFALTRLYAGRDRLPHAFTATAIFCSVIPDIDIVGLRYGVPYGSLWGHRGLTHSLLAAVILGLVAALAWFKTSRFKDESFIFLWMFFFVVTASHPLLDAMTNGGLGVALFSPFNPHRYFLAWRPILVAPISVSAYLQPRGLAVLKNEMLWLWIPSAVVVLWSHFAGRSCSKSRGVVD